MISVVIPTLNEEKFLPHLLKSLTTQTFKNFEVIVVDGSSEDKTVALARKFQADLPLLTIVTQKPNTSGQRNRGAAIAKGNWLVFMDADNILMPYAFERIVAFIKRKKPVLFTTWFCPDSEIGNDVLATLFINMYLEAASLLRRPHAPGPLTIVAKREFDAVGGYDEAISWAEDYDLTKRVCERGTTFMMLRETLYIYSLRRFRHQGTLKTLQSYARGIFSVLLTNKAPHSMPGYIMGGHPYIQKRRPITQRVIREVSKKFKGILKELFA